VRTRLWGAALAGLSVAVLAGCTTTSSGTPLPGATSSAEDTPSSAPSEENDALPSDGAPKVTNPIDASHFEQNPCDMLTTAQAQDLDLGPGKRQDTNFGKGCDWRNSQNGGSIAINFASAGMRGLSSTYRSNKNGDFTYFEAIDDIEGHPAVAYDINTANPTAVCFVAVGLTDQLTFSTRVALSANNVGKKDPCELSAMVAGIMMKNMQEES
jgi:hypothetical protein